MDLALSDSLLANKWIWNISYESGLNQSNNHILEITKIENSIPRPCFCIQCDAFKARPLA